MDLGEGTRDWSFKCEEDAFKITRKYYGVL